MKKPVRAKFLSAFIFLLTATRILSVAQTWQVVTPKYGTNETVVAGFVADAAQYGNGSTDATAYIQASLNSLDNAVGDANHGGGVLYLPEGKYKISSPILIPKGITIRGDWQKPVKGQPLVGTILMAYNDKGNASGTPFITMQPGAAVIDLAFWYPDQDPNAITPYPPTIQFGQPNYFGNEFCNVKNVTLVNSYSGIYFYTGGGTCPTINNVYGTPLKQGIEIDRIVDIGRTEHIDFSPAYWAGSGLAGSPSLSNTAYTQWIYNNGIGIVMRRNDWSYTSYVNIEGYNKGFYATKSVSPTDPATPNGHNYGFTFTNCKYGVYFDGSNTVGIMFTEINIAGCEYGVCAAPNTGGVLQLYKWNINATNCAIFSDQSSATKITMQESTIAAGKVQLQGGVLIATDNDFNNAAPQIQFELNSRGNLTGNRYKNPVQISEKSVFLNQIDNSPVSVTKLPPYYEFIPQTKKPLRNVMYNVTSFGVTIGTRNAIPAADATTGIQNALNKAKTDGGGIVFLPPGHYRINGSLIIPSGVELKGSVDVGEFPMGPGSVLEVYGNKGNETGAPCIQMQQSSGLRGVVFNYPDQVLCTVLPSSVFKFPYTVQAQGSDVYIINVGFRAAYKAVDLFTYQCDRFYLDFLTGHVFNAGAQVGAGSANGIISNMQFNPIVYNNGDETKFGSWPNSNHQTCSSDATKSPYDYVAKNLDFLTVGSAPNILLYNDFNYGANHGLILQNGASGTAIGLGLDGDRVGILVDGNANFNFTNTQDVSLNYDALGGEQSSYIKTTANYTAGSISLFSSDYWGQATSSGIVMNGAGTVNLQSANFESPGSQSFANVNNGTLNIVNSVVNPKDPLVNGTKLSGVNITGSQVNPYSLNTGSLGTYRNDVSGAKPSPTSSLSRTGWIASASRSNTGRDPKYSIDGDANTSWSSGWQNDGVAVWYQVDMLSPQTFNEVILDYTGSPNDGPAGYNFSVSNDGVNWTQVATGTGPDQMTIISFPTATARYIRLDKPAAASKSNFLAIHELYVFNVTTTASQAPYNGTAFAIPGTIEAEQYDTGGEGVAYHDVTTTNDGDGNFRTAEGVDIGVCSAGGYDIGWTSGGEWVEYTVNVASTGLYDIKYLVASGATGSFHLEMDNTDITGTLNVST
ncbi:MAG: discoidin domain-containing protein, partial [Cytophagaceae bacterium]